MPLLGHMQCAWLGPSAHGSGPVMAQALVMSPIPAREVMSREWGTLMDILAQPQGIGKSHLPKKDIPGKQNTLGPFVDFHPVGEVGRGGGSQCWSPLLLL